MAVHQGDIIERVIRRQGHSLTDLAKLTGVNRRSIYNWFLQPKLKPENIIKIGQAIHHDFSVEFPGQFVSEDFIVLEKAEDVKEEKFDAWKEKYIDLLERYNLLLRIANGELKLPAMQTKNENSSSDVPAGL
jgi:lambda repressor-like predicted transcriptional regulator